MSYLPSETLQNICETFEGKCALYVSLPFSGEKFTYRAEESIPAASTIKVPLLAMLFRDAEAGRLDLEDTYPMAPENRVRGSGILKFLSPDVRLSLYDHAVLMTISSDNSSTNHVIDALGIDRANAYFKENGWTATELNLKIFVSRPGDPRGSANRNYTSARDLGDIMEKILAGTMVSKDASAKMMSILACQQLGKFSKALPNILRPVNSRDPITAVPEGKVMMAQKGGTLTGIVSHEAAIMLLPNGRHAVLVMMTECEDKDRSLDAMKQVARLLYDHLL